MWVLSSVPEVNIFDCKVNLCISCCCFCNNLFTVKDFICNSCTICIFYECLNFNICIVALYCRCNHNTWSTVIFQIKMSRWNANYFNASVNTAVECEISSLRINLFVRCVISTNCQKVCFLYIVSRNFYSESGITTVVNCKRGTVPENLCGRAYSIKFKIIFFACEFSFCNFFKVVAFLTLIVIATVLTVLAVPGVWEIEVFCAFRECRNIRVSVHCEKPVFINIFNCSHFFVPFLH